LSGSPEKIRIFRGIRGRFRYLAARSRRTWSPRSRRCGFDRNSSKRNLFKTRPRKLQQINSASSVTMSKTNALIKLAEALRFREINHELANRENKFDTPGEQLVLFPAGAAPSARRLIPPHLTCVFPREKCDGLVPACVKGLRRVVAGSRPRIRAVPGIPPPKYFSRDPSNATWKLVGFNGPFIIRTFFALSGRPATCQIATSRLLVQTVHCK
jgi:hypothetical protein